MVTLTKGVILGAVLAVASATPVANTKCTVPKVIDVICTELRVSHGPRKMVCVDRDGKRFTVFIPEKL